MTSSRRLVIRGRVQGVGFRDSLCREAERLGVKGWVRNRSDGSVEALVQGTREAVEQMVAWARRGPPFARVTEVRETSARDTEQHLSFRRLPSE